MSFLTLFESTSFLIFNFFQFYIFVKIKLDDESSSDSSSIAGTPPASRSRLPKPRAGAMLLTRSSVKDVLRFRSMHDSDDDDEEDDKDDHNRSAQSRGKVSSNKKKRSAGKATAKSALTNKNDELTPGETGIRNLGNTCYLVIVISSFL